MDGEEWVNLLARSQPPPPPPPPLPAPSLRLCSGQFSRLLISSSSSRRKKEPVNNGQTPSKLGREKPTGEIPRKTLFGEGKKKGRRGSPISSSKNRLGFPCEREANRRLSASFSFFFLLSLMRNPVKPGKSR